MYIKSYKVYMIGLTDANNEISLYQSDHDGSIWTVDSENRDEAKKMSYDEADSLKERLIKDYSLEREDVAIIETEVYRYVREVQQTKSLQIQRCA